MVAAWRESDGVGIVPRILPVTDIEITNLVKRSLEKQGMEFHFETKVVGAETKGGEVTVKAETKEGVKTFTGDKVLVSVGRRAVTQGLGLEALNVKIDKGNVIVDDKFQTNVPGLYAIGDLIDGPMLAHKAMEEGIAFAEMLAGQPGHVNYDAIPTDATSGQM